MGKVSQKAWSPRRDTAQGHEERHRPEDGEKGALPGITHGLEEDREDEARDKRQEAEPDPAEAVAADGDHQGVPGEEAEHGPRQKLKAEKAQEHQSKAQEEGDLQGLPGSGPGAGRRS